MAVFPHRAKGGYNQMKTRFPDRSWLCFFNPAHWTRFGWVVRPWVFQASAHDRRARRRL